MRFMQDFERWSGFAPEDVRDKGIRPIPCERARVVVTIDGRPYAGFGDRATAEGAIALWLGEVNGIGFPVIDGDRGRSGWPAARGHTFSVVER